MQGRRLPDSTDGTYPKLEPGDYILIRTVGGVPWFGVDRDRPLWIVCSPNGNQCYLNNNHTFEVDADGALTVRPSILMSSEGGGRGQALWHGYLERGVWRTC